MAKKREYINDVKKELIDRGYIILSDDNEYKNTTTNLRFKCGNCGCDFKRNAKSCFKSHPYCVKCTQKIIVGEKLHNLKVDEEKLHEFLHQKNINYEIRGYDVYITCQNCGKKTCRPIYRIYEAVSPELCDICSKIANSTKRNTLNKEIINEKLKELNSNTICVEEGNFKWKDKIHFKCSCGNVFVRKPNTVISSRLWQCHDCSKFISKGERVICDYLESHNIEYIYQKTFEDCRNVFCLPFDFYLPQYNTVIEYDGEFHYNKTTLQNDYEGQLKRDDIKTNYCSKNGIILIRIPYYNFDNITKIMNCFIYGNIVLSC